MKVELFIINSMMVCCYLLSSPDSSEAALIDPAGNAEKMAELLKEKKLTCKYIINTHGHGDHTGGNTQMKSLTGAAIVMHAADDELFSLPQAQMFTRQLGFTPSPRADITVKDGDVLTLGQETIHILHTPGHSPGGICLLADGHLFTGDTLFIGSIGRTDLPGSSHNQLMDSLRLKILPLPDNTIILPGHAYGPESSSTLEIQRSQNPFLRRLLA